MKREQLQRVNEKLIKIKNLLENKLNEVDSNKKYELTDEVIHHNGKKLYRIKALKSFNKVKTGDLGGYVESEKNLSQRGTCWIFDIAKVFDNAKIYDNAGVHDTAEVYQQAEVYENSHVYGDAKVFGKSKVFGSAHVYAVAKVFGSSEVFGKADVGSNKKIQNQKIDK